MKPVHHHVVQADLTDILPTQATIGYVEVAQKRRQWQALNKKQRKALVASQWFPSVIGPGNRYYITDHHHLGMALHEEGQATVLLTVLKDLSWLSKAEFWRAMEFNHWVHPYNEKGQRIDYSELPKKVSDLLDDPYRSIAGLARSKGAYAKDVAPYAEFIWADHFRTRIDKKLAQKSMSRAVDLACDLAKMPEASYLPGWAGSLAHGDQAVPVF